MNTNTIDSLDYKDFASPEVNQFLTLLEHPKVQSFLKLFFDNCMATSEMKVLKRLGDVERVLGLNDMEEEGIPTIPERIEDIKEKLENVNSQPSENPSVEIKPKTKTGKRAVQLIKALMGSGKDHLTRSQIREVLSDETLEDARLTPETSNPRRVIIDALNEAGKLCSKVIPDQKGYGRHEWRLLLRS
jgi:hypothetical protein